MLNKNNNGDSRIKKINDNNYTCLKDNIIYNWSPEQTMCTPEIFLRMMRNDDNI